MRRFFRTVCPPMFSFSLDSATHMCHSYLKNRSGRRGSDYFVCHAIGQGHAFHVHERGQESIRVAHRPELHNFSNEKCSQYKQIVRHQNCWFLYKSMRLAKKMGTIKYTHLWKRRISWLHINMFTCFEIEAIYLFIYFIHVKINSNKLF